MSRPYHEKQLSDKITDKTPTPAGKVKVLLVTDEYVFMDAAYLEAFRKAQSDREAAASNLINQKQKD